MALVNYKYTAPIHEMQAFRFKNVRHPHQRRLLRMAAVFRAVHPHLEPPVRMRFWRNWVSLSLLLFIVNNDAHSA